MNAAQINDQLAPRRHRGVGIGAIPPYTIPACAQFTMTVKASSATYPTPPAALQFGLTSAPDANGNMLVDGVNASKTATMLYGGYGGYQVVSIQVTGRSTTGPCAPPVHVVWVAPPQAPSSGGGLIKLNPTLPVFKGSAGSSTAASPATTTSNKTPYYVAGAGALALAAGAAYWKYGRK